MKIGLSPLQGQASFEETLRECERAEATGFDSIWLGEHHNNPVLYPAPLIGLTAVASRTRSIRLGTGVLLLPLYHPVMVAEEGAMVDMISGGSLILGIGAGYAPEEFAALVIRSRSGEPDWRRALPCFSVSGRRRTSLIMVNIIGWITPQSLRARYSGQGRPSGSAPGPSPPYTEPLASETPGSWGHLPISPRSPPARACIKKHALRRGGAARSLCFATCSWQAARKRRSLQREVLLF